MFLRYLKYALSTVAGTAVETLIIWLLADFVLTDGSLWRDIVVPFIGFECALMTNYVLAYTIVWRSIITERSRRDFLRRLPAYHASCLTSFLLKMPVLLLITRIFGLHLVYSNFISLAIVGFVTFLLNDRLVFRSRRGK